MESRGERLAALVAERELDRLLVTDLVNVRYLTGFGGTNGACVCGEGVRVFLTDFRYTERAEAEVEGWEVVTVRDDWLGGIAEHLAGRTGFEDHQVAVRVFEKLKEKVGEGVTLEGAGGTVEKLRRVKDEAELAAIAAAAELADEIWRWSLQRGLAGRTELEVARAAEARMRELGAEPSFPTIVAAGPNGALPHAEPQAREIGRGELVVFDMGAKLDGYCSDGTRTFATGEPGEEARAVYATVLEAQEAALAAVRAGARAERSRRRRPRADRRRRPRRALRPWPRPWGRARGARGAARLAALRGRARGRRSGDDRARDLPARRARCPHRGSGRRHRRGPPQPQRLAQGSSTGGLSAGLTAACPAADAVA